MIGPSSGTNGVPVTREIGPEDQVRIVKRRQVFNDLDPVQCYSDETRQNGHKRYVQEIRPINVTSILNHSTSPTNDMTSTLFSSDQEETNIDGHVARLEVLVIDSTGCSWTAQLDHHQASDLTELTNCEITSIPSPSMLEQKCESNSQMNQDVEEIYENYQDPTTMSYWESVPVINLPQNNIVHKSSQNQIIHPHQQHVQPNNQQQPIDDQENGNLSWLLDFKLDPFIDATEDRSWSSTSKDNSNHRNKLYGNGKTSGSMSYLETRRSYNNCYDSSTTTQNGQDNNQNSNYDRQNFNSKCLDGAKKPPFTYTELIEHALQEKGELTVSAIYQWISEHFPYYKSNDDRWKNSVRHNLSINPHFRKGSKAPHGAGHLWAIANRADTRPRQNFTINGSGVSSAQQFIKTISENNLRLCKKTTAPSQVIPMDEVEIATANITRELLKQEEENNIATSTTLEHCAEQILSGIKKEVEVQYIMPMAVTDNCNENRRQSNQQIVHIETSHSVKETDFLNPVAKEIVAEECGLLGEGYLVTDINPAVLGLNMVDPDQIIASENLFDDELSFQFYEITSPSSQLQSA